MFFDRLRQWFPKPLWNSIDEPIPHIRSVWYHRSMLLASVGLVLGWGLWPCRRRSRGSVAMEPFHRRRWSPGSIGPQGQGIGRRCSVGGDGQWTGSTATNGIPSRTHPVRHRISLRAPSIRQPVVGSLWGFPALFMWGTKVVSRRLLYPVKPSISLPLRPTVISFCSHVLPPLRRPRVVVLASQGIVTYTDRCPHGQRHGI
jgi:hypothetical protein